MAEMYDLIYYNNYEKTREYYSTDRVYKLGEYAIHSLSEHYKYKLLPHLIARHCESDIRFYPLDLLRHLRTALFFNLDEFIDIYNKYCQFICILETYVNFN